MPGAVRLHRVLAAKPEKVYRAFIEPNAQAKWFPPNGFYCTVHYSDVKVGGMYKMSFTNFTTGKSQSFGGEYIEIVPNKRLRITDRFDDASLPGEMTMTVVFEESPVGTTLHIVQEGIPDQIPVDGCYLSWQQCLNNLANLVEPDIQG